MHFYDIDDYMTITNIDDVALGTIVRRYYVVVVMPVSQCCKCNFFFIFNASYIMYKFVYI